MSSTLEGPNYRKASDSYSERVGELSAQAEANGYHWTKMPVKDVLCCCAGATRTVTIPSVDMLNCGKLPKPATQNDRLKHDSCSVLNEAISQDVCQGPKGCHGQGKRVASKAFC